MNNNDALLEMTQAYLNFSDEQMDLFKTNPRNIEILPQIPNLLNTEFTFEVIEAHGCICQHKAGQKIIINGDGSVSKDQGPEKVCIYLLQSLALATFAAQEFIYAEIDPNKLKFKRLGCFDTGINCNGVGHVVVEFKSKKKS